MIFLLVMTKKTLRSKTRKLAKELLKDLLNHIDKSLECVECESSDRTEWGHSYAIINAYLIRKSYPVGRVGSKRVINRIIAATK